MKRNIEIYIKDILENIERVEKFVGNMGYEEFSKDEKTHFAVIRCIEIIGEAAKQVPEEIRKKFPDIPWGDLSGIRDKLIHFKIE